MRIGISALPLEKKGAHSLAGVARYTYAIINALLDLQSEHTFVLFVGANYVVPEAWVKNPKVELVTVTTKLRWVRSLWNTFLAIPLAKKHRIDVWFGTSLAIPLYSSAPRVLTVHDLFAITNPEYFTKADGTVFASALKTAIPRAEHLLSISQFTKDEVIRLFGIPADRITVTHLGPGNLIDRAERTTDERGKVRALGVPYEKYFFSIGTLEPRKNLLGVVRAAAAVADQLREMKAGVVFAGAKGWKNDDFYNQIKELGVEDLVHFLGYVPDDDLPALFSCCEATVFPSFGEGFGLPALEAQMYGSMLICSNKGAIPEVAGPGAVLVDVHQPAEIGKAMIDSVNLPDRDIRIAQGYVFAFQFTWERCARQALDVFERLAKKA